MTTTAAPSSWTIGDREVTNPVRVRAARQAAATFVVNAAAAQQVIDHTGLRVQRQRGGVAMMSLAVVDYADNDLDSYVELAMAFVIEDERPADERPKGSVSTLIHRLPVDQEFTCAAGRQIWGFPKWVADLRVTFDARGASCVLREHGEDVVRLRLSRGRLPMPRRPLEMAAYSYDDDGVVRCTPWTTVTAGRQTVRPGGAEVELGYGHPIADELRALGLPKRSLVTMFDNHMTAEFGPPQIIERQ